jgi:hypothetical protein
MLNELEEMQIEIGKKYNWMSNIERLNLAAQLMQVKRLDALAEVPAHSKQIADMSAACTSNYPNSQMRL